jgi:hypothetical protein
MTAHLIPTFPINGRKRSWRTTTAGILAALGTVLTAVGTVYPHPGLVIGGAAVTAASVALLGTAARDHKVCSADAGIKPTNVNRP